VPEDPHGATDHSAEETAGGACDVHGRRQPFQAAETVTTKLRPFALLLLLLVAACDATTSEDDRTPLDLPVPTGPFQVGTTVFHLVDADRDDAYTPGVVDAREVMVQVWYPTDASVTARVPYMDSGVADAFAATQDYMTLEEYQDAIGRVRTHSMPDVPVAGGGPYPVVFYSHGLAGSRFLYTTFIEDLASHGYVVVGVDHTFGALAVEFPGGRLAGLRAANAPPFETIVRIWAEDLQSVLDELEARNGNDPAGILTGTLDLTRVGAAGHSTGGSAAVQVHTMDDRFSAAVSLDAPQVGDAADGAGLDDPGLLFFASPSEFLDTKVQQRMSAGGFVVTVDATTHYNFTDLPVLLDLAEVPDAAAQASARPPGAIDAGTGLAAIAVYTRAFFDRHLKGEAAPRLDGSGGWPEAVLEVVPGG